MQAISQDTTDYRDLLEAVTKAFADRKEGHRRIFLTDAADLNELYLDNLPSERQHHNCHTCRDFINRYGSLATVAEDGSLIPLMWGDAPEFYADSFAAIAKAVSRARIVAPFVSPKAVWGSPVTGTWTHMAVTPPAEFIWKDKLLTAGQKMAASKESFRTVASALAELDAKVLDEAIHLLETDSLNWSEKFLAPTKWLRALLDRPKGRKGENLLWKAIAEAPEGYLHPKASVLWPLLDDIKSGLPFSTIKSKFGAMVSPLIYQRPQAAPSAGNIKAAEEMVAKLGIAPSLERRFARIEDFTIFTWKPTQQVDPESKEGVFGHLKTKQAEGEVRSVSVPPLLMTLEKFMRTILPTAERLELSVPSHGRFIALTTAVNADAPPILRWDKEDARNPLAWYVYPSGSGCVQWGLRSTWTKVSAIVPFPGPAHIADGYVLILDGARDTAQAGNALFPVCLKDDLHAVRSTIEAYSRTAIMHGREEASACGYDVRKGSADCHLRAFSAGRWTEYRIDRWD